MHEEEQKILERALLWKSIEGISVNKDGVCLILGGGEPLHIQVKDSHLILEFKGKEILKV